eukprot:jgi/Mesvir1/27124/Mv20800-RA.1
MTTRNVAEPCVMNWPVNSSTYKASRQFRKLVDVSYGVDRDSSTPLTYDDLRQATARCPGSTPGSFYSVRYAITQDGALEGDCGCEFVKDKIREHRMCKHVAALLLARLNLLATLGVGGVEDTPRAVTVAAPGSAMVYPAASVRDAAPAPTTVIVADTAALSDKAMDASSAPQPAPSADTSPATKTLPSMSAASDAGAAAKPKKRVLPAWMMEDAPPPAPKRGRTAAASTAAAPAPDGVDATNVMQPPPPPRSRAAARGRTRGSERPSSPTPVGRSAPDEECVPGASANGGSRGRRRRGAATHAAELEVARPNDEGFDDDDEDADPYLQYARSLKQTSPPGQQREPLQPQAAKDGTMASAIPAVTPEPSGLSSGPKEDKRESALEEAARMEAQRREREREALSFLQSMTGGSGTADTYNEAPVGGVSGPHSAVMARVDTGSGTRQPGIKVGGQADTFTNEESDKKPWIASVGSRPSLTPTTDAGASGMPACGASSLSGPENREAAPTALPVGTAPPTAAPSAPAKSGGSLSLLELMKLKASAEAKQKAGM